MIASRIFTPEPAAASFLLENCAHAFKDAGWDVRVLTTRYLDAAPREAVDGISIRRSRVLRNADGYVKGYASYLSFDIPLFFRLLFMRRADLVLVEPPPTTGAAVRVAAGIRRIPYVVDAADIWSDAAVNVTGWKFVLRALLALERFALRGARHNFVVAPAYAERMRELGILTPTSVTGFGVDTTSFEYRSAETPPAPLFVYGGSYSEWHGAGIFVEAFEALVRRHPDARLVFVGNGSERPRLTDRVNELGLAGKVEFRDPVPPRELSRLLSEATASLASLQPGAGYDYAFVTKVYASMAVGCPVVFTGAGPTGPFMRDAAREVAAGVAVDYDVVAVAAAMEAAASSPSSPDARRSLSAWTRQNHSLRAVADRMVAASARLLGH